MPYDDVYEDQLHIDADDRSQDRFKSVAKNGELNIAEIGIGNVKPNKDGFGYDGDFEIYLRENGFIGVDSPESRLSFIDRGDNKLLFFNRGLTSLALTNVEHNGDDITAGTEVWEKEIRPENWVHINEALDRFREDDQSVCMLSDAIFALSKHSVKSPEDFYANEGVQFVVGEDSAEKTKERFMECYQLSHNLPLGVTKSAVQRV